MTVIADSVQLHNPYALDTDGGSKVDFPKAMMPTGKKMTFECWRHSGQEFLDNSEYLNWAILKDFENNQRIQEAFRNSSDGSMRVEVAKLNRVIFDKASSEHMTYPSYSPVGSDFTIEIRFKILDNSDWKGIAGADGHGANGSWRMMVAGDDDDVSTQVYDDSGNLGTFTTAGADIQDGNYHIYSMVVDRVNDLGFAYIDGVVNKNNIDISALVDDITIGNANSFLASRDGGADPTDIEIAEFRIWSDVRTPTEISDYAWRYLIGTESNLVRYYDFSTQAGTAVKSRVDGGLFQGSVDFVEASNHYMTVPVYSPAASDFTIEMLCKIKSTADWRRALAMDNYGANGSMTWYLNNDDERVIVQIIDDSGNIVYAGSKTGEDIQDSSYHLLSLVIDRGNDLSHFYIDGENVSSGGISGLVDDITIASDYEIAKVWGTATYMDMEVAEFRVWSDVRTPSEIADNYLVKLAGTEAGLERYYIFEDAAGASVDDLVGANDGTLVNAPNWLTENGVLVNTPTWSAVGGILTSAVLTLADIEGFHHFAFSVDLDAGDLYIYLDGEVLAYESGHAANKLCLMYPDTSFLWFSTNNHGKYSDVRFWNDVRSEAEIRANMFMELEGDEAGLVAYYKGDERTGTTLGDSTSGSHDATITDPQWVAGFPNAGPGWVDISDDVLEPRPFSHNQGISGDSPTSLVASPGRLSMFLKNDDTNTGGKAGYYSPDHADVRDGFKFGAGIRVTYTFDGSDYIKWRGRIYDIHPSPSTYVPFTKVVAYDWLMDAQSQMFRAIEVDTDQRGDEALHTLVQTLPLSRQPAAYSYDVGKSIYPYVFDSERDEKSTVLSVAQKIAQSELARIYVNHQGGNGQDLVFENRHHSIDETAVKYDFDDSVSSIRTSYPSNQVITKVVCRAFPREIDSVDGVLGQVLKSFSLGAGETKTIKLDFRDADSGSRISAASLAARVSGTDYIANADEDGGGANRTADLAVAVATDNNGDELVSGNAISLDCTNNGASMFWVITLQQQGKGIKQFDPVTAEAKSTDEVIAIKGEKSLRFDLPYEDDYNVAVAFGDYLLGVWESPQCLVTDLEFWPHRNDTLAQAFCDSDVGHRITVNLPQVGIDQDYFINQVSIKKVAGLVKCKYKLRPAGSSVFMQLDDPIYAKLDAVECKLAF